MGTYLGGLLPLDVVDRLIDLTLELLDAVPDAWEVDAITDDDLGNCRCFRDVFLTHPTER